MLCVFVPFSIALVDMSRFVASGAFRDKCKSASLLFLYNLLVLFVGLRFLLLMYGIFM